ncbi:hypothetical protein QBC38DRAFT_152558 [Podospora fimiseda]|uniref:Heterokaryon incompatibility domain-containing protein n=1 Tax=Podospora fimiseda TaxID=252190 RepID=A0AAN7H182_9PEZI|nr:hypothetical protein QBC38DRAFT_152558 [Podospora fimiseda]
MWAKNHQRSNKRRFVSIVLDSDDEIEDQESEENLYHQLPLQPHSIRLLQLLPHRDKNAPIECRLTILSLDDSKGSRPYEALSYAWGSAANSQSILVNQKWRLPVGQNLYTALIHLRDHSITRNLWVDAICINQSLETDALEERSQQVQAMAKIYAQATRVVVWLGESINDSDQALEEIRVAGAAVGLSSSTKPAIIHKQAILALLMRPWFRRFWVLQEVAAARHILIKCGDCEVDGYAFCVGINALTHLPLPSAIFSVSYLMRGSVFRPRRLEAAVGDRFSLNIGPLSELIDMYHSRDATDIRDKVYALLGMCSDDPSTAGFNANYKATWGTVFKQLIYFILSDQVSVETGPDKQVAVIQCHGRFLGEILTVQRDPTWQDRQHVVVAWLKDNMKYRFALQLSEKPLQVGDFVYQVQGASKPSIIRLRRDRWAIVMIAVCLRSLDAFSSGSGEWPAGFREPMDFRPSECPLVWDWHIESKDETEARKLAGLEYIEYIATIGKQVSELGSCMEKIKKLRGIGLVLREIKRYDDEFSCLRRIMNIVRQALRGTRKQRLELQSVIGSVLGYYGQWTVACLAAFRGHDETLRFLLNTGKIRLSGEYLRTAVWLARRDGHEDAIKVLGAKGFEFGSGFLQKAFLLAVNAGNSVVVRMLLEGVQVDPTAEYIKEAMGIAIKTGNEPIIRFMLNDRKVDPNVRIPIRDTAGDDDNDMGPQTLLHQAVREEQHAIVQLLLGDDKLDPMMADSFGYTAIDHAAMVGETKVVRMLLEDGRTDSQAALQLASAEGHADVVRLLVNSESAEANPRATRYTATALHSKYTATALYSAAKAGHAAVVKTLLENGRVNPDDNGHPGENKKTALHVATEQGHTAVVEALLESGRVDPDRYFIGENISGSHVRQTAIHVAAERGYQEIVKLLVDTRKVTLYSSRFSLVPPPLYCAVKESHADVVKVLLDTGEMVGINWKVKGYDPPALHVAVKRGDVEIVTMLLKTGNVDRTDIKEAFELAKQGENNILMNALSLYL